MLVRREEVLFIKIDDDVKMEELYINIMNVSSVHKYEDCYRIHMNNGDNFYVSSLNFLTKSSLPVSTVAPPIELTDCYKCHHEINGHKLTYDGRWRCFCGCILDKRPGS